MVGFCPSIRTFDVLFLLVIEYFLRGYSNCRLRVIFVTYGLPSPYCVSLVSYFFFFKSWFLGYRSFLVESFYFHFMSERIYLFRLEEQSFGWNTLCDFLEEVDFCSLRYVVEYRCTLLFHVAITINTLIFYVMSM